MASTPVSRKSWRLRGLMDEYLVIRGVELQAGEAQRLIPADTALWRLRGWRGDAAAERALLEAYEALGGRGRWGMSSLERRSYLERAWVELEEAFQSARLVLLQLPRPVFISSEPEEKEEDDWEEEEAAPTSWVGLQIEDEAGEPVASQRVRLKLPDGTFREAVSDDKGRLRLEGIPAGTCQVELLGMDAADWRAG